MTEPTVTITKPKKKRTLLVVAVIAIAVLAVAAVVISRAGLDKDMVKQKLDEYIAMVKERGEAQGRSIDITYGDLDVVGGFTDRHVIIHDVAMVVKPSKPAPAKPGETPKSDSLTVTTSEITLYPTAIDLSSLRVDFPQPINFAGTDAPDKSLLKVVASAPLEFVVNQESKAGVPYVKVDHKAPDSFDFTYLREQQANGKEDATPEVVPVYDTLHAAIATGSTIHADVSTDGSKLGTLVVDIKEITLAPQSAPTAIITIAGISINSSDTVNADKQKTMQVKANVGPINGPVDVLPNAPFAFQVDGSYVVNVAKSVPSTTEAAATPEVLSTLSLKSLSLTTKDAGFSATADFNTVTGDMVPTGAASLVFTNVPFLLQQLEKTGALNSENETWILPLVVQITGTPIDQLKDVTIPLERQPKGSFKIGKSSLEELATIVIQHMLAQRGQTMPGMPATSPKGPIPAPAKVAPAPATTHAPALPAANKPKATPIPVPDNGVRG